MSETINIHNTATEQIQIESLADVGIVPRYALALEPRENGPVGRVFFDQCYPQGKGKDARLIPVWNFAIEVWRKNDGSPYVFAAVGRRKYSTSDGTEKEVFGAISHRAVSNLLLDYWMNNKKSARRAQRAAEQVAPAAG